MLVNINKSSSLDTCMLLLLFVFVDQPALPM